jgi:hypothetical protein
MNMFLIVFAVMLLFFALMGVGLIVARKPIRGTCASLSTIDIGGPCEICGGDPAKCDNNDDAELPRTAGSRNASPAVQQYSGAPDAETQRST